MIGLLLRAAWADPQVQERGSHRLFHDPQASSNHLLLLSLGGTNSRPADLAALDRLAAQMGYHVVALDYPNSVISTACRNSPQPDAFERFRQEIVAGVPVSDLVQVDRDNSIEGRLTSLLGGLQGSWEEFYEAGQPVWGKMVAIGHSQGSGHAAYLGKQHKLRGVIILAGPQDTGASGPAPWLSRPGATPGPRYQALLHKDDTFGCAQQLEAVRLLRGGEAPPEAVVVADEAVSDAHMSVIQERFKAVWRQLLQSVQAGSPGRSSKRAE